MYEVFVKEGRKWVRQKLITINGMSGNEEI